MEVQILLGVGNYKINFNPYYTFKDILGFLFLIFSLLYLVFYNPNLLGHSDNYIKADPLITPNAIVPEWYLLSFYAILRSIENKILGVLALLFSILILLILPFNNSHFINTSLFRPLYKNLLIFFFFNFLILLFIGQQPVIQPYITIGLISTILYFSLLIIFWPLISFIEFFFNNYTYTYHTYPTNSIIVK